jgi:hypothetical protein
MADEKPQVMLDDLLPIDWDADPINDFLTSCPRCEAVVIRAYGAQHAHERWHAAIEDLTVRPMPVDDLGLPLETEHCGRHRNFINSVWQVAKEAGIPQGASITEWLRSALAEWSGAAAPATMERLHHMVNRHGCQPGEDMIAWVDLQLTEYAELQERTRGLTRGEVERLRRIEDALTKAGAPNRSERGDPGGLVVRWIEKQVQVMAELREENKAAGRAIEALADRVPEGVYTEAVNRVTELEKQLAAVPKSVREMHQDLVEALGLDQNTPFYEALDVARKQAIELAAWHGIQDANAVLNKRSSTVTTVDPGGHRVTVHMDPALPEDWQQQIAVIVANPPATSEVITRIAYWLGVGKVHTCEAHCSLPHVEEGGQNQDNTEPVTDQVLSDLLLLVGVTVTPEQLAAWTPEQREQAAQWAGLVHLDASDNDVDVPERPTFLDERPAEAEACPSLYLWHDTDDGTYELLECKYTKGHPTGWDHKSIDGGHWDDKMAVPSPWPVDREPPAGITCLRDTGSDWMQYLLRSTDGWIWSAKLDGTGDRDSAHPWQEAAGLARTDLVVVRP